MVCKFCSTKNTDDAVFCKACGKRIDGKQVCKKCNSVVDEDAVFCTVCGSRLDEKTVCEACGTVYEGNFCPACGKSQYQASAKTKKAGTPVAGETPLWKKILSIVGTSVGFAGAFFAFVFMFFTGIGLKVSPEGAISSSSEVSAILSSAKITFFDCFGDNFTSVSESLSSTEYYTDVLPIFQYYIAIAATVIAAVTIICTTTFFILATYRFIRTMMGRKTKSAENMIIATIISFVTGAICFRSLFYMSITAKNGTVSASYGLDMTAATIVGISLSLIFCILMIGLKIAVKGSSLRGSVLAKTLFSGSCTVVALILLLVLSGPIALRETKSGASQTIVGGFIVPMSSVASLFGTSYKYSSVKSNVDKMLFTSIAGHIIAVAFIIVLAVFVAYIAMKTADDKHKSPAGIILASFVLLLSVAFMIVSIITTIYLKDFMVKYSSVSNTFTCRANALPYIAVVLSVLLLAAEITHFVLQYNLRKKEQKLVTAQ